MNTTIVYILTSSDKDIYIEQLWLSLYSLRLHNPEVRVVLLTDDSTEVSLVGDRAKIRQYLSEVKVVDVTKEYTLKERSRFIKTTYRKYLKGNLLFLDTDTIIADSLSSIDVVEADVACVLDYHAQLDKLIDGPVIRERMIDIFGVDVGDENNYFNSGVMFVKDTPCTHQLFEEWHKNWKIAAFEKNQCFDQPALLVSDKVCGHIIKELSGVWNCQVLTSIQYLHHAKIIHFFNNTWEGKSEWSPFFDDEIYKQLKREGEIPTRVKEYINDPKSAFFSPAYFVCKRKNEFLQTLVGATLYSEFQKNGILFRFVKLLCKFRYFFMQLIKHG